MAQWGRNDEAVTLGANSTLPESSNGAPIGTWTLVKGDQVHRVDGANAHFGDGSAGSRSNTDSQMFGNTTVGAFIPNMAVGVFGVDATETDVNGGPLASGYVSSGGSGYGANASVTLTVTNGGTSGVVNAHANATGSAGKIDAIKIQTAGSGYISNPTIAIAAPAAINIVSNTSGFSNSADCLYITSANSRWQVGDRLYYSVPTGNTPLAPLTGNTYYYVTLANTTAIKISVTKGGTAVNLTDARDDASPETHTVRGDTATGYVVSGGSKKGITHAGWVVRREGTGGRAGRVQYETLVAMGSLGANTTSATGVTGPADTVKDASDDTLFPDS